MIIIKKTTIITYNIKKYIKIRIWVPNDTLPLSGRVDTTESHGSPLSSTPIVHRSRQLLMTTFSVRTELMQVLNGQQTLACLCVGVYQRILILSLSLVLQLWPPCLVHLTRMVWEMRSKWPYNSYFLSTSSMINSKTHVAYFPSSFFSMCFVRVQVVDPPGSTDTATDLEKPHHAKPCNYPDKARIVTMRRLMTTLHSCQVVCKQICSVSGGLTSRQHQPPLSKKECRRYISNFSTAPRR